MSASATTIGDCRTDTSSVAAPLGRGITREADGASAILFAGGIGDEILALPALRALRAHLPGRLRVAWVGRRPRVWAEMVDDIEWCAVQWDGARLHCPALDGIELVVSLTTWPHHVAISELLRRNRVRRSIGFFPFYDEVIRFSPDAHMLDKYFAAAAHLVPHLDVAHYEGPPAFPLAFRRGVSHLISERRQRGRRLAFFHPETKRHKEWSSECWARVLSQFLREHSDFDVLTISAKPYPLELGLLSQRVLPFHESLEVVLCALAHADLFIGVDSCFLHAADAHGVPGVALFGPTEPRSWGFRRSPIHCHLTETGGQLNALSAESVSAALLAFVARLSAHPSTPKHVGANAARAEEAPHAQRKPLGGFTRDDKEE